MSGASLRLTFKGNASIALEPQHPVNCILGAEADETENREDDGTDAAELATEIQSLSTSLSLTAKQSIRYANYQSEHPSENRICIQRADKSQISIFSGNLD